MYSPRITPYRYLARRKAYSYPAVGLRTRTVGRRFASVTAMERHLYRLFRSANPADVVLGYLSVIYWGHYLGRSGKPNAPRALSKVHLALGGLSKKGLKDEDTAALIRAAASLLRMRRSELAIRMLMKLPQLKMAFASKVCSFLDSDCHGVIDRVIARKYRKLGFAFDAQGYVSNGRDNILAYVQYCQFLTRQARSLNSLGTAYRWRERAGPSRRWRAVDVERALYAS